MIDSVINPTPRDGVARLYHVQASFLIARDRDNPVHRSLPLTTVGYSASSYMVVFTIYACIRACG